MTWAEESKGRVAQVASLTSLKEEGAPHLASEMWDSARPETLLAPVHNNSISTILMYPVESCRKLDQGPFLRPLHQSPSHEVRVSAGLVTVPE
jgi:hypothetical protein